MRNSVIRSMDRSTWIIASAILLVEVTSRSVDWALSLSRKLVVRREVPFSLSSASTVKQVSHNLLPWLDLVQKSTLKRDFLITSTATPHVGDIHDRPTWTYSDQKFWSVMVFVVGEKLFPSMQTTWSLRKYFCAVYHNSRGWKLEERLDQHPWFPRRYFVEST